MGKSSAGCLSGAHDWSMSDFKFGFTVEAEEKSQLPFLDALVQSNEDNLTVSVHQKKTRTD